MLYCYFSARCSGVSGDYCNVRFIEATILRETRENFHKNKSLIITLVWYRISTSKKRGQSFHPMSRWCLKFFWVSMELQILVLSRRFTKIKWKKHIRVVVRQYTVVHHLLIQSHQFDSFVPKIKRLFSLSLPNP